MTRRARAPSAPASRHRAALLLAAALAACGSGLPYREPLHVVGRSGGRVAMTNTSWRSCTDDGAGGSQSYREVHGEEGSVTFLLSNWAAPGCTGAETSFSPVSAYAESRGDTTVRWTTAPPPGLPDEVPATRVLVNGSPDLYLVDDTTSPRVLYTGDPGSPPDADGWPTQLRPVPEVEQ